MINDFITCLGLGSIYGAGFFVCLVASLAITQSQEKTSKKYL